MVAMKNYFIQLSELKIAKERLTTLEEKKQIIRVLESKGFTIVSIRITWGT